MKNKHSSLILLLCGITATIECAAPRDDNTIKSLLDKAKTQVDQIANVISDLFYNKQATISPNLGVTLEQLVNGIRLIDDKRQLLEVKDAIKRIEKNLKLFRQQLHSIASWHMMNFADLEQKIESNFIGTTIEPGEAYTAIGLNTEDAIDMSWQAVRNAFFMAQKRAVSEQQEKNFRQLDYIFRYDVTKQEYDAYLQGKDAFEKLKNSIKTYELMMAALFQIDEFLLLFAEIDNLINQKMKR